MVVGAAAPATKNKRQLFAGFGSPWAIMNPTRRLDPLVTDRASSSHVVRVGEGSGFSSGSPGKKLMSRTDAEQAFI